MAPSHAVADRTPPRSRPPAEWCSGATGIVTCYDASSTGKILGRRGCRRRRRDSRSPISREENSTSLCLPASVAGGGGAVGAGERAVGRRGANRGKWTCVCGREGGLLWPLYSLARRGAGSFSPGSHPPLPAGSCLLLTASLIANDHAAQGRTVWMASTPSPAERGRVSYQQSCVGCHRDDLRGDNTAPSLVGESFMFLWGDMEVGELSARIQKVMPPERPGSLPAQAYIDIVTFILQKNGLPAGNMELGADPRFTLLITASRPG